MVGASFHHLSDMLGLLVDRHGTDDSTLRRWGHHLDRSGGDYTFHRRQKLHGGGLLALSPYPHQVAVFSTFFLLFKGELKFPFINYLLTFHKSYIIS